MNRTSTCKQHTDEAGGAHHAAAHTANCAVEGSLLSGEAVLRLAARRVIWEAPGEGHGRDEGEGDAFPGFHSRNYEQECKVNCAGMGHVCINPV